CCQDQSRYGELTLEPWKPIDVRPCGIEEPAIILGEIHAVERAGDEVSIVERVATNGLDLIAVKAYVVVLDDRCGDDTRKGQKVARRDLESKRLQRVCDDTAA